MPKSIEPYRREPANYPFRLTMDTQFSDMDAYGHLNNIAIARYYESARARFHLQVFESENFFRSDQERALLVETRMSYLAEGHYPAPVEVCTGIGRIGNSSYELQQALFQNGGCIGLCEAVMVLAQNGKAVSLPPDNRERIHAMKVTGAQP